MSETTTGRKEIETLSAADAIALVERVGERAGSLALADAIKDAARHRPKREPIAYLARYPYGSQVVDCGRFRLPPGVSGAVAGLDDRVPLCFVVANCFEAYRPSSENEIDTAGRGIDAPRSLRLLRPGELFGVFEVADRVCGVAHGNEERWSVSAGARTARLLYPLNNRDVKDYLFRQLRRSFPAVERITTKKGDPEEWTWHLMREWSRVREIAWHAEVIVFPHSWLEISKSSRLLVAALKGAWLQGQDDRLRAFRRQTILEGIEKSTDLNRFAEHKAVRGGHAVQLLMCIDDVTHGRSVAHALSSEVKDRQYVRTCGPFDELLAETRSSLIPLRRDAAMMGVVAVPKYLEPGESGFISLSRPTTHFALLESAVPNSESNGKQAVARVSEVLKHAATGIEGARDVLGELIPQVHWNTITFFGKFGKESEKAPLPQLCEYRSELSARCGTVTTNDLQRIHSSSAFFLQCIEVRRKVVR